MFFQCSLRREVTASETNSTDNFWSITRLTSVEIRFLPVWPKLGNFVVGTVGIIT